MSTTLFSCRNTGSHLIKIIKFYVFSSNYTGFGISAMINKVSSGIFYGRPHGGVSILVHNKFVKFVKNVSSDDRFVICCIDDVVYVNVYLPCKSNLNIDEYTSILIDTLDQISGHVHTLNFDRIVLGGDFNVDLRHTSAASDAIFRFFLPMNLNW